MVKRLLCDRTHISGHGNVWGARGKARIRLNRPELTPPRLAADRPWESATVNWMTLRIEDGLWRLWYEAFGLEGNDFSGHLCYAESRDGVNWDKPELGLCEYGGDRRNNIVIDNALTGGLGIHGHSIFVDPTAPPEARYRIFFVSNATPRNAPGAEIPVMAYGYSADGVNWHMGAPELPRDFLHHPIVGFGSDTQCVVYWDGDLRRYVGYFRTWAQNGLRSIARSETDSLLSWPMPRTILTPDMDDGNFQMDYYNNAETKYVSDGDTAHYIFYSAYDHNRDTLSVRVAVSRDGIRFERPDRGDWVAPDRDFCRGGIYLSTGIHELGGGRQAVVGNAVRRCHNGPAVRGDGGLVAAVFPRDRILGLSVPDRFEFSVTGSVDPRRPEVTVNADVRGSLRAGLIAPGGRWVEGFSPEDCVPVRGNGIDLPIRWRGGEPTVDRAVLKLFAEDADLWAVTVNDDRNGM